MRLNKGLNNEKYTYCGTPSDEDYELLKKEFIKDGIEKDKLFVFALKACDNLVDRSFEMFSTEALESISKLIKGKPYIEDHNREIDGQRARVYKAEVVTDEERVNEFGEPYKYVLCFCYMVNNDRNKYIIDDIMSGIRKEASVGCSADRFECSICGDTSGRCGHIPGREYLGKQCVRIIDSVDDFYEISCVTVPCQREAGIIKSYKEESLLEISKALVELAAVPGISSDVVNTITKAVSKSDSSVREELTKAQKELKQKEARIKELEENVATMKQDKLIGDLLHELHPRCDSARGLAERLIRDSMEEQDGEYVIPDNVKEMLMDEYSYLFDEEEDKGCGEGDMNKEESEEDMEEDVEDEEMEEMEEEKEEEDEGVEKQAKNSKKSIEKFTRSASTVKKSVISARTLNGVKHSIR